MAEFSENRHISNLINMSCKVDLEIRFISHECHILFCSCYTEGLHDTS